MLSGSVPLAVVPLTPQSLSPSRIESSDGGTEDRSTTLGTRDEATGTVTPTASASETEGEFNWYSARFRQGSSKLRQHHIVTELLLQLQLLQLQFLQLLIENDGAGGDSQD